MTTVSADELSALRQTLRGYRACLHRLEAEQEKIQSRIEKLAAPRRRGAGIVPRPLKHASAEQLIHAIIARDVPLMRRLLRDGVHPNSRDQDARPALVLAASCVRPLQMVRALLRGGAAVGVTDGAGNTALIVLSRDEDVESVKELIKHGANVNAKNRDGDTPLTNAAIWGATKVVRYLLSHAADPKLTDGVGLTPLELARQHQNGEIVDLLT